jgi:hypothetical protein
MEHWQAIVLEGPKAAIRAFLAGFVAGRCCDATEVVLADELDVDRATLLQRLRDLVARRPHHVVLAAPACAATLIDAVRRGVEPDIVLGDHEPVVTASFTFTAETPSVEAARRIHDTLVVALPEGTTAVDVTEEGELDPAAHGVELRAIAHEFTYRARGTITGEFPGILAARRRAAELDFVTVSHLRLVHPG